MIFDKQRTIPVADKDSTWDALHDVAAYLGIEFVDLEDFFYVNFAGEEITTGELAEAWAGAEETHRDDRAAEMENSK